MPTLRTGGESHLGIGEAGGFPQLSGHAAVHFGQLLSAQPPTGYDLCRFTLTHLLISVEAGPAQFSPRRREIKSSPYLRHENKTTWEEAVISPPRFLSEHPG